MSKPLTKRQITVLSMAGKAYKCIQSQGCPLPVSYTHLDVYKRQGLYHVHQ